MICPAWWWTATTCRGIYNAASKAVRRARAGGASSSNARRTGGAGTMRVIPTKGGAIAPKEEINMWKGKCPIDRLAKEFIPRQRGHQKEAERHREGDP